MAASLLLFGAAPVAAQERLTLPAPTDVHREPDGTVLGTLVPGVRLQGRRTPQGWLEATVSGWMFTASLDPANRDGYDLAVSAPGGENLRDAPNGAALGRFRQGALLRKVETQGGWTRVRRVVWVRPGPPPAAKRDTAAPRRADSAVAAAAAPPAAAGGALEPVALTRGAPLRTAPDGSTIATLPSGTRAAVVARADGWVRVQVDGWVREAEVQAAPPGDEGPATAAELRADPARYAGQPVRWRLQFIALRTADALRPEMPEGTPYVLARGPLPEAGFVYLALSREQVATFRGFEALREFTVRGTIRTARTRYLPVPVVDFVALVDRTP